MIISRQAQDTHKRSITHNIKGRFACEQVAVGGNTIRVWGGGIYETETFYETADRLGLIILQDGSFFGSYPTLNKKENPDSPANKVYC